MVTLTKRKLKAGFKYVDCSYAKDFQVPESVEIGSNVALGWSCDSIGENCVIGPGVQLDTSLGSNVVIGEHTDIQKAEIGNNATVGSGSYIEASTEIKDGVTIGNNVLIGRNCHVRKGTVIPDNWMIPANCIVNPGVNGTPVVIVQPTFRCNVQGSIRTGNGY